MIMAIVERTTYPVLPMHPMTPTARDAHPPPGVPT
jgi:hypothetical protein